MLTHVELLMAGLGQAGYDITVACPIEEQLMKHIRAAGVSRILPLDIGDDLRPCLDPLVIWRFSRFLRHHPFAIVHAHGAKAGLITRLALSKLDYPVVVSYHNELLSATYHPQKRRMRAFVERRLAQDTDHFIAVSPTIRDELIQCIGCSPAKVSFIPNGILLDDSASEHVRVGARRTVRSMWGWPEGAGHFVVGTACRLTREKGIDILLAAASQAIRMEPTLRLVIFGDGPLASELEGKAQEGGLSEYVRFLGYCDRARELFPALDAFVLPSRTEGWPLSIMEAMAVGLPVIATRVGGVPHMVETGRTGLLVAPGEVDELAQALLVLARDRSLARRLGEAAADYAEEHFDVKTMVARVGDIYAQIWVERALSPVVKRGN